MCVSTFIGFRVGNAQGGRGMAGHGGSGNPRSLPMTPILRSHSKRLVAPWMSRSTLQGNRPQEPRVVSQLQEPLLLPLRDKLRRTSKARWLLQEPLLCLSRAKPQRACWVRKQRKEPLLMWTSFLQVVRRQVRLAWSRLVVTRLPPWRDNSVRAVWAPWSLPQTLLFYWQDWLQQENSVTKMPMSKPLHQGSGAGETVWVGRPFVGDEDGGR